MVVEQTNQWKGKVDRMWNIFEAFDVYWRSDQSFLDEFAECSLEHLQRLAERDAICIKLMVDYGEEEYWEQRAVALSTFIPSYRKPISLVWDATVRHERLVLQAIQIKQKGKK